MKTTAIIAEYNPFHNGHKYHIEQARQKTNADYVMVLMSGNFTQRGNATCFDKFIRTKMALQNGADLVLELPVCYATSSAETFAEGGISLFTQSGVPDFLCFGAEGISSKENALSETLFLQTAHFFVQEQETYQTELKRLLKTGLSFPHARSTAAKGFLCPEAYTLLTSPNNILGLEYCKALLRLHSSIQPIPILRKGAGYHETQLSNVTFSSATAIRQQMELEQTKENPFTDNLIFALPENIPSLFSETGFYYMTTADFYPLLQYQLQYETTIHYTDYFDVSTELADRLQKLLLTPTYDMLVEQLKTKQYTRTRIERALLHILLRITEEEFQMYRNQQTGYLRILGFRKEASALLKTLKANTSIPVITKLADAKKQLSPLEYQLLCHDIRAGRLYNRQIYQKHKVLLPDEYAYLVII